jgi:hypothetical protein
VRVGGVQKSRILDNDDLREFGGGGGVGKKYEPGQFSLPKSFCWASQKMISGPNWKTRTYIHISGGVHVGVHVGVPIFFDHCSVFVAVFVLVFVKIVYSHVSILQKFRTCVYGKCGKYVRKACVWDTCVWKRMV